MKSIQSRLLIMLLMFIILPYFLSVFLIYSYTKNSVEQHELENSREQIQESSEELEQYFNEMIDLPYILYRDPELFRIFNNEIDDSAYLEKSLENYFLMRKEIRQVRLYLDKGKESLAVYNGMVSARKSKPDFLEQNTINELYDTNVKYPLEPPHPIENYNEAAIVPQSDNSTVMTFHHKIVDVLSNEFLGILTTDIDLDVYAQICQNLLQEDEETVMLVNENANVIYANDQELIGKPVTSDIKQKMNTSGGKSEDIILSKTLTGPLQNWKLVKITPSEVLFQEVRKTAYTSILVGIGVGLLGVLMISMITYKITHPIKQLTQKVRSIEGGDTHAPFDDSRTDEIGYLEKHMKEMMDRINRHIDREYKLEIENKENQFRALKSQVNPHFLFNSLQSIGAVALRSKAPHVYQLVTSLSKMMRYSMKANKWVLVHDEVNYIEAYLMLQKERFRNNVNYSIKISDTILQMTIPSMILQPLVENFFKHSYEEGFHEAHLTIHGEIQGKVLQLAVENDGPSLTDEELHELRSNIYTAPYEGTYSEKHIGLKNIHDRLILNYGHDASLEVDTIQGQGFLVKISIPLQSKLAQ
ncbi:sensor histidine kinase [Halobacillus sp. Marseille-Q1614]|uniref:cache domain-containing sensor histidine kinase n=1 Tax=Halobacillus sp. Marseille-Q1614 TaxID=2709134 RepID=UPI00156FAD59|nr:sensor histidine kinase [Halobacillus sp. Marseille-Q1614]